MSQGEKRILIPAGAEGFPVRAAGDFIFVRAAAFPVRVIVDGQPITMEAGEKRVLKRKNPLEPAFDSFQVDNLSTVEQQVIFITGEGDYEKIIVSGELNVSAYVNTAARGQAKSLPAAITRRLFVDNAGTFSTTNGTIIKTNTSLSQASPNYAARSAGFWRGRAFTLQKTLLTELNLVDATVSSVAVNWGSGQNRYPAMPVHDMAISSDAWVYFRVRDQAQLNDEFYRVSLGGGGVETISFIPTQHKGSASGMFVHNGAVWVLCFNGSNYRFERFDLESFDWGEPLLISDDVFTGLGGLDSGAAALFDYRYNVILMGDPSFIHRVSPETGAYLGTVASGSETAVYGQSGVQTVLAPDLVHALAGTNNGLKYVEATSREFYGALYTQKGDDVATRRDVYLTAPANFYTAGSDIFAIGQVASWVLQSLGSVPANYLDYLTAVEIDNGLAVIKNASGTQTFSLRGIGDNFTALSGTDVTIEILPEYFN